MRGSWGGPRDPVVVFYRGHMGVMIRITRYVEQIDAIVRGPPNVQYIVNS